MRDELHTFIRNGYLEGVVGLVDINAQLVIAKSNHGRTSLHLAVLFGNLDIIEILIKANHQVINMPDNVRKKEKKNCFYFQCSNLFDHHFFL